MERCSEPGRPAFLTSQKRNQTLLSFYTDFLMEMGNTAIVPIAETRIRLPMRSSRDSRSRLSYACRPESNPLPVGMARYYLGIFYPRCLQAFKAKPEAYALVEGGFA